MCPNACAVEAPFSPISGVRGNRSDEVINGQLLFRCAKGSYGWIGNAKIDSTLGQLIITVSGQQLTKYPTKKT